MFDTYKTMNESKMIGIPKPLWDELENALMIKSKQLISDIARTLRQDEKSLIQEFRSKKTNIFLLELDREEEEEYECPALVSTKKIAHKCRKPRMYAQKFCPEHEFFTMTTELESKPTVQRIASSEDPLFLDTLTQQVYTIDHERVGYLQNDKCIVFEIV